MREVRQASTVIRPTPCWSLLAVTVPASVPPTPAGSTPSRGTAPAGAADVEPAAPAAVPVPAAPPAVLTAVAAKNDGGATLVYGSAPSTAPTPSRKIDAHAARIATSTSAVSTPALNRERCRSTSGTAWCWSSAVASTCNARSRSPPTS